MNTKKLFVFFAAVLLFFSTISVALARKAAQNNNQKQLFAQKMLNCGLKAVKSRIMSRSSRVTFCSEDKDFAITGAFNAKGSLQKILITFPRNFPLEEVKRIATPALKMLLKTWKDEAIYKILEDLYDARPKFKQEREEFTQNLFFGSYQGELVKTDFLGKPICSIELEKINSRFPY